MEGSRGPLAVKKVGPIVSFEGMVPFETRAVKATLDKDGVWEIIGELDGTFRIRAHVEYIGEGKARLDLLTYIKEGMGNAPYYIEDIRINFSSRGEPPYIVCHDGLTMERYRQLREGMAKFFKEPLVQEWAGEQERQFQLKKYRK